MTSKKPLSQKREEITEMKGKSFRERGLGKSIHSAEKPVGAWGGWMGLKKSHLWALMIKVALGPSGHDR